MPGHYDRDNKIDLAIYRLSKSWGGVWILKLTGPPLNEKIKVMQWGLNGDTPVGCDYDGDGLSDLAVWRDREGMLYIRYSDDSHKQRASANFGFPGDIPISYGYVSNEIILHRVNSNGDSTSCLPP